MNLFEFIVGNVYIIYLSCIQSKVPTALSERQSREREIVGSSPAVGKNFSFCNPRSLRVANTSNQPIQMKSTVTYT